MKNNCQLLLENNNFFLVPIFLEPNEISFDLKQIEKISFHKQIALKFWKNKNKCC